ncbi:MAG: quinoprotein dehydrogenase-associated putative ABC transporter substrate-binding protein [Acidobacteria bacterium]|nr:MAG: quinoprotein dehydrogenase-associated putative ABC transporter substrate-binding protein [Acidobacteriota bacterium]
MSGESRAARPRSRHASHWVVAIAVLCAFAACVRRVPPLRVCADPNNLPFSNDRGEGFENRIAELLAADRHARVEYTWWAQRRGFVRNTLSAGACDLMIGVPSGADIALTTRPYYRSTYVFVSRADRGLALGSFDDSRLRRLRIGVQMIGDDFANTPPAHALAARGMVQNIVGYSVYGDYSQPHPLSGIIDAVAHGAIDAAVVWGPEAGYFARDAPVPMTIAPVTPPMDRTLPFAFDISMGVRKRDIRLRDELNDFLDRRGGEIDSILSAFGIPRVEAPRS